MPSLSAQSGVIRSLLSTPLPGQAELEADAHSALLVSLGEDVASMLPEGALASLTRELCFVVLVLLKRVHLAYTAELGICPLCAQLLVLAVHAAPKTGGGHGNLVCRGDLAAIRSDTLNTLSALLAKFAPATVAGVPWGMAANGAPSPPPNQALLSGLWLVLQWEAPALAAHLQFGGGVSMLLGHSALSLLSTAADPPAFRRLIDLALWDASGLVARCHAPLLVCAMLLRNEATLMALPPEALHDALRGLRISSVLDAERTHATARRLALSCPSSLRATLDAAWCAAKKDYPPYACAWLLPDELAAATGGFEVVLAAPAVDIGRCWVLDLRSSADFDASHFALTTHLPPDAARRSDARAAAREKLRSMCVEGGFGVAIVTATDPLAQAPSVGPASAVARRASGVDAPLSADDVRLVIHEFVREGFRRVGALYGGFAALPPSVRETLVTDDVTPTARGGSGSNNGGGGNRSSRLGSFFSEGAQRVGSLTGLRGRAKPAPM